MRPLLDRIRDGEILVGDGAMGTMLIEAGLPPGTAPEAMTVTHPNTLLDIARRYVDAGADIVEANTFGASPLKLALAKIQTAAAELNHEAVRIAREAAGDRAHVVASVGPSGHLLEPYGDTAPDEVYGSFRTQVTQLVGAGIDAVFVETMTDLTEATLAIRAAKDVDPALPVAAMMTFDATPRGFFTVMGVSVEAATEGLLGAGADLIGSNCGNGVAHMVEIARAFREATDSPLIIQPNAGLPQTRDGRITYDETPQDFAARVPDLLAAGVSVIGGCCGSTPAHVQAIKEALTS